MSRIGIVALLVVVLLGSVSAGWCFTRADNKSFFETNLYPTVVMKGATMVQGTWVMEMEERARPMFGWVRYKNGLSYPEPTPEKTSYHVFSSDPSVAEVQVRDGVIYVVGKKPGFAWLVFLATNKEDWAEGNEFAFTETRRVEVR